MAAAVVIGTLRTFQRFVGAVRWRDACVGEGIMFHVVCLYPFTLVHEPVGDIRSPKSVLAPGPMQVEDDRIGRPRALFQIDAGCADSNHRHQTCSRACEKSSIKSRSSSHPTEIRTRFSPTPIALRCESVNVSPHIAAGWTSRVSNPPRLAA